MPNTPTGEPFYRVTFASTDDYLMLSAALASRANASRVAAALAAKPAALILQTSPNSEYHPVWFVNRAGRTLVGELGLPVKFGDAIEERRLPRRLIVRLGERGDKH
jgi:hypothetical protein